MSWTDERVELLRQLWLDGKSASQISAALGAGLTRNAVIGKVHRLGLAGRVKASSSSSSASSSVPRGPSASRRPSPRPSSAGGGMRVVRGNTVLAMLSETELDAQPARLDEDVVVPMSLRVTIVELKEEMCRWPLGDPTTAEFRYCGAHAPGVGPYCAHHGKLAYQPTQDRRRERERERRPLIAR
jgi:GcrA cell cycle regulator